MFDKNQYGKILVPIVTPFKEDQNVDYDALISIGEKLIKEKYADTLVLTGTTGEFFTMSFDERCKVFELMKRELGKKIPLIAGTGAVSTREAIALSEKAQSFGYETIMIVAPYYMKPSQVEILNHYKKISEKIKINITLYNIPIFTGVNIAPETVAELSKKSNIVAIKEEAEINPKQMTLYLNVTHDNFIVYCGDDTMVLEALAQGGERIGGFISGASHIIGNQMREMIDFFRSGQVEKAAAMQRRLLSLFRSLGQNGRVNPVALLKEAMKLVGYPAGIPRLPLLPGTEEEISNLKEVMKSLDII